MEDSDSEFFLRKNTRSKEENYSLKKDMLCSKVGEISTRLGRFLMPFAFGITPLVQVICTECPQNRASVHQCYIKAAIQYILVIQILVKNFLNF